MNKKKSYIIAIISAIIVLVVSMSMVLLSYKSIVNEKKDDLQTQLKSKERELSTILLERSQVAHTLSGFIASNSQNEITDSTFLQYAQQIEKSIEIDFLSLQWAPKGVIKHVYPLKDSKEAVGLDLFDHKTTRDVVLKSFRNQKPHINGPVELVQGGMGVIFRVPVYDIIGDDKKFLGFSAVVFDWNSLIEELGWVNNKHNYKIALKFNDDSSEKEFFIDGTFFGDSQLFSNKYALTTDVFNSFGSWELAIKEKQISNYASTLLFYSILGLIFSLLTGYWVYNNNIKIYYIKLQKELLEVKNKEIEKQIGEKIILLNEVHHRVKNNFQLISSLARLQSYEITDQKSKEAFEEFSGRVSSLAITHEQLYKKENIQSASIKSYVESLCDNLLSAEQKEIEAQLSINDDELPVKQVISLGIIINELITNSLKYAFNHTKKGKIKISFERINNHFLLQYFDNGKGMDDEILETESPSFGIELIKSITEQIDGKIIQVKTEFGSGFKIEF